MRGIMSNPESPSTQQTLDAAIRSERKSAQAQQQELELTQQRIETLEKLRALAVENAISGDLLKAMIERIRQEGSGSLDIVAKDVSSLTEIIGRYGLNAPAQQAPSYTEESVSSPADELGRSHTEEPVPLTTGDPQPPRETPSPTQEAIPASQETRNDIIKLPAEARVFLFSKGLLDRGVVDVSTTEFDSIVSQIAETLKDSRSRVDIPERLRLKLTLWKDNKVAKKLGVTAPAIYLWWNNITKKLPQVIAKPEISSPAVEQEPLHIQAADARNTETPSHQTTREALRNQVVHEWSKKFNLRTAEHSTLSGYLNPSLNTDMTPAKQKIIEEARRQLLGDPAVRKLLVCMSHTQRTCTLRLLGAEQRDGRIRFKDPETLRRQLAHATRSSQMPQEEVERTAFGGMAQLLAVHGRHSAEKASEHYQALTDALTPILRHESFSPKEATALYAYSQPFSNTDRPVTDDIDSSLKKLQEVWQSQQKEGKLTFSKEDAALFRKFIADKPHRQKPERLQQVCRDKDIELVLLGIYETLATTIEAQR